MEVSIETRAVLCACIRGKTAAEQEGFEWIWPLSDLRINGSALTGYRLLSSTWGTDPWLVPDYEGPDVNMLYTKLGKLFLF